MVRRTLTMADRSTIAAAIMVGLDDKDIGEMIDRDPSIIWRERRRNSTKNCGYRPVHADCEAERRPVASRSHRPDCGDHDMKHSPRVSSRTLESCCGPCEPSACAVNRLFRIRSA